MENNHRPSLDKGIQARDFQLRYLSNHLMSKQDRNIAHIKIMVLLKYITG